MVSQSNEDYFLIFKHKETGMEYKNNRERFTIALLYYYICLSGHLQYASRSLKGCNK